MPTVYLKDGDGKVLLVDGKVAIGEDCCCGECTPLVAEVHVTIAASGFSTCFDPTPDRRVDFEVGLENTLPFEVTTCSEEVRADFDGVDDGIATCTGASGEDCDTIVSKILGFFVRLEATGVPGAEWFLFVGDPVDFNWDLSLICYRGCDQGADTPCDDSLSHHGVTIEDTIATVDLIGEHVYPVTFFDGVNAHFEAEITIEFIAP